MDEMLHFLRAIAGNPDDDVPRLVFADWLEENGHPDRAEFIRLQVELENMDPGDEDYAGKTARMRRCGVFTTPGTLPFFDHLPTGRCKIAFRRGFIESVNTAGAKTIDTTGLGLIPLRSLRTGGRLIDLFKGVATLRSLEYAGRDTAPARLLKILGPQGWFKSLEELCLPDLNSACLAAGVIPQLDLPRLRNLYICTKDFYSLGASAGSDSDPDDGDSHSGARPWGGLPEYLPRNALPNGKIPLERFVWHSEDDCDFFHDEDWYWRGPSMDSVLGSLREHRLRQVELVVDYDDHENGAEGVIAAPYRQNPLEMSSTLDSVTLDADDLPLLGGATRKLSSLRVYGFELNDYLFTLLNQPVCSELESLHVEARGGYWGAAPTDGPSVNLTKLKSLCLRGLPLGRFSSCQFPNLTALRGCHDLETLLGRKWPKLQHLDIDVQSGSIPGLKALAASDCCPNLTSLTIRGYFKPGETDFSFLADCPHMPFLSLIRLPDYPQDRTYIIDSGELLPARGDVMLDEQIPTTLFRVTAVF